MIRIITDSTAYLKKNEAMALSVTVVPMTYTVNHKGFNESYADCNGDFESLIKSSSEFSTSQPNTSAFLSAFSEELSRGNEILCITISSRLSGTYSAAFSAARQTESQKIAVLDSQLTAGGLYLLLSEAQRLVSVGEPLEAIVEQLTAIREKISVAFSVENMTPLRHSGRLGFVRMSVGTALNMKPILLCRDGAIVSEGVVRGSTGIIKKLAEMIPPHAKSAVVNYIGNSLTASNLYYVIRSAHPSLRLKLQKMGPVLGIHLGLQVVAVSFITE